MIYHQLFSRHVFFSWRLSMCVLTDTLWACCSPWPLTPRCIITLTVWQVSWGVAAGPLLRVRAESFYHTTHPVMDEVWDKLGSGQTALLRGSGSTSTTPGFRLIPLFALGGVHWAAKRSDSLRLLQVIVHCSYIQRDLYEQLRGQPAPWNTQQKMLCFQYTLFLSCALVIKWKGISL